MLTTDSANALYEVARVESDRLFALLPEWPPDQTENLWLRTVLGSGLGEIYLAWKRAMYERKILLKLLELMALVEGEQHA